MIEKKLHEAPLLPPSTAFDRKIQALIHDSALYRTNLIWRPVPIWTGIVACIAFTLLGFFAHRWPDTRRPKTDSKQVIYVVERTEALRNLVRAKAPQVSPGFFQTKKTNIEMVTPSNKRAESLSFEEGL